MKNTTQERAVHTSILGIVTGFVLLYFLFDQEWMLYVAGGVGLASILFKSIAKWIDWGWMQLARAIGFVNSRIILSAIFFLFLFPISLLYRLTNRDPLNLKSGKDSYFKTRNHQFKPKDLENPW